jgi:hypothetical protein
MIVDGSLIAGSVDSLLTCFDDFGPVSELPGERILCRRLFLSRSSSMRDCTSLDAHWLQSSQILVEIGCMAVLKLAAVLLLCVGPLHLHRISLFGLCVGPLYLHHIFLFGLGRCRLCLFFFSRLWLPALPGSTERRLSLSTGRSDSLYGSRSNPGGSGALGDLIADSLGEVNGLLEGDGLLPKPRAGFRSNPSNPLTG